MARSWDYDEWDGPNLDGLYEANRRRAIRGARGQATLRELLAALDAMPVKELGETEISYQGQVCALGAYAAHKLVCDKGLAWPVAVAALAVKYDETMDGDSEDLGVSLGMTPTLARTVAFQNDEGIYWFRDPETRQLRSIASPSDRWAAMRQWVAAQIIKEEA
jgi:hypothetical protein